jgi:ABC-type transporter Mla MlaB component
MYRFPAEVAHQHARRVLAEALAVPGDGGGQRRYDLSACERFDSSLLAVLLALLRSAQAAGEQVSFDGVGARLFRLAVLYGVGGLLFGAAGPAGPGPAAGAPPPATRA